VCGYPHISFKTNKFRVCFKMGFFSFAELSNGSYKLKYNTHKNREHENAAVPVADDEACKPKIEALTISTHAHYVRDSDISDISCGLCNLNTLILHGTYNITHDGYESMFANCKYLHRIDVADEALTDRSCALMAMHCKFLEYVTVRNHRKLSNYVIESFVCFKTPLICLKLIGCHNVTGEAVGKLAEECRTLSTLRYSGGVYLPWRVIWNMMHTNVANLILDDMQEEKLKFAEFGSCTTLRISYCDEKGSVIMREHAATYERGGSEGVAGDMCKW